jgi:hypothetical protein
VTTTWPPGLPSTLDYPEVPVGAILAGSARRFGPRAAVQPPQMMRLSRALGWTAPVTTVDAFVDRLAEAGG